MKLKIFHLTKHLDKLEQREIHFKASYLSDLSKLHTRYSKTATVTVNLDQTAFIK